MGRPFALDARLNAYRVGGIPAYTARLLEALVTVAPEEQFLALEHRRASQPLLSAPNLRHTRLFTPPHHRWEQIALPLELLPHHPRLIHSPDFIPPLWRPCPAVITVHDLAFLRFPEILDAGGRRFYGQIHAAVASAEGIIAVSEATRRDLVELLGLPATRITVIHEAAAGHFRPPDAATPSEQVIGGHRLQAGAFLLFVSTLEPRKNLPTLLAALRDCLDRQPATPYQLVLAGARGWRDEAIFASLRELRLSEHVIWIERFSQTELRWLYGACRVYLNPSRYEGFGLPVLEALACGAPTIISDTSSLPEVAGEAAWRVPPLEREAWSTAIERLWHDDAARAELHQRGPVQAARFSWERAARETLALYRQISA